jgi:hypothetical protein
LVGSQISINLYNIYSQLPTSTIKVPQNLEEKIEPPYQESGFQIGFFPQGGMGMGHLIVGVGLVGERVWRRW